jgi:hypothetical protein
VIRFLSSPLFFPVCGEHDGLLTVTAARKALQDSLHEDDDEDDEDEQRYLNLNEEEGDVWDEDSAYIEMLAKEVRVSPPLLAHQRSLNK